MVDVRNSFRIYGPIIEEAMRQSMGVHLLLRDSAEMRNGWRGYNWPDPEQVPVFRHGTPQVSQWRTSDDLAALCAKEGIAVVVSLWLREPDYPLCRVLREHGVRWVSLQHGTEHLVLSAETLLYPDATCMFSPYWVDNAIEFHARHTTASPPNLSESLRRKLQVTGSPELDVISSLDPELIRQQYGVPEDRPVVVWLPHDVHWGDLWEMLVFRRYWSPRLLLQTVRGRRLDILRKLGNGVTHPQLLHAIRDFCDRNGAFLIVKSRVKEHPPDYEKEVGDLFIFERLDYPPTILEVLSIADLCLHVFSVAALEAAYIGVPGICLVPPPESWFMAESATAWRRSAPDFLASETMWNFKGVASMLGLEEAVRRLPGMRLNDFKLDPGARDAYVRKFLGPTDGAASANVLGVVRAVVAEEVQ